MSATVRPRLVWFYVGAVLGPYGGSTAAVLLTTLQDSFATDLNTASYAVSLYMVAYAGCLLFSGALSDTFGSRVTITFGCAALGLGSILCTVAPSIEVFLAGRTLQGVGNAFTTALLMAALPELVPSHRLGTALGSFAAFQMAGATFGPLGAGLVANLNWRLNFAWMAVLSVALTISYWRFFTVSGIGLRGRGTSAWRSMRELIDARMGLLCLAAFVGYAGAPSIGFLIALHLERTWGVPPALNGFILAGFGLVHVFAAPQSGKWVDRFGRQRMILIGTAGSAALLAVEAIMPWPAGFAIVFALIGLPAVAAWTALGTVAVQAFPRQRGTATAWFSSAKFAGMAVAPVVFLPLYLAAGAVPTFLAISLVTLLMVVPVILYGRLIPVTPQSATGLPRAEEGAAARSRAWPPRT